MSAPSAKRAVFVFPSAAGHVNPSLPLARGLVARGWRVDFLATAQFEGAISDTGATFCDRDKVCKEHGGIEDVTKMVIATAQEYGDPPPQWWLNFGSIAASQLLPVYLSWFKAEMPQLVVYCPVLCQVARFAAMKLGIANVSLLTAAGPGYFDAAMAASLGGTDKVRPAAAGLVQQVAANAANARAVESLRQQLGAGPELTLNTAEPLNCDHYSEVNLVSTTQGLADPLCAEDAEFYRKAGKAFHFVGPLLDTSGARRGRDPADESAQHEEQELMRQVEGATGSGRAVVYVSMGTVVTSDHAEHGWNATSGSALTGRASCHAVYRAVFEELGSSEAGDGMPLIVLSLGRPQQDALEGLGVAVPANAVCAPSVPQVDLLRLAKPKLFVTNGGQNSLMESMAVGSPVLVCPGFGDQQANAAKVESQGWGKKVDRPGSAAIAADPEGATGVAVAYQAAVRKSIREVLDGQGSFGARARAIADGLAEAVGVDGALKVLIGAAASG